MSSRTLLGVSEICMALRGLSASLLQGADKKEAFNTYWSVLTHARMCVHTLSLCPAGLPNASPFVARMGMGFAT
jgi:hypothetical protein